MIEKKWKKKILVKAVVKALQCGVFVLFVSSPIYAKPALSPIGGLNLSDIEGPDGFEFAHTGVPEESWSYYTYNSLYLEAYDVNGGKRYVWSSLANGDTESFDYDGNGKVTFAGAMDGKSVWLFDYLAKGKDSYALIANRNPKGIIDFIVTNNGGAAIREVTNAKDLYPEERNSISATFVNYGTMNFIGSGFSPAVGEFSGGVIENYGTINICELGIGDFGESKNGVQALMNNNQGGVINIVGDGGSAIKRGLVLGLSTPNDGEISAEINNSGELFVGGGNAQGAYGIKNVIVRHDDGDGGGVFLFNNEQTGKLTLAGGNASSAIDVVVGFSKKSGTPGMGIWGVGLVLFENKGVLTISGECYGACINAINTMVYGPDSLGYHREAEPYSSVEFENSGVMNWVGSNERALAIGVLTDGAGNRAVVKVLNSGVWNLSKYAIGEFGPGEIDFRNQTSGIVNAEAGAIFDGEYSEIVEDPIQNPAKKIYIIESDGFLESVETSEFKVEGSISQQGNLTLKQDWIDHAVFEAGGSINFTDIAAGTELSNSIRTQFEAAFGTGTKIYFTGTGSGSGSSTFDMNVVNALISENQLAPGSVVTSEALTHKGKSFTLANSGDMTQDTGFMGILGSTGITVKDGKTLTLMGSQASMAMAVGDDDRDASYVVTDAATTLENGTLNLGHQKLSATEGVLSDVIYDASSAVNVNHGIFTLASLKGEGELTVAKESRATIAGDLETGGFSNSGVLTVNGKTTLKTPGLSGLRSAEGIFINEKNAEANFTGGVDVTDFAVLGNRAGGTIRAGHVRVDPMGMIENLTGATMELDSLEAYGVVRQNGTLKVAGNYTVSDANETVLKGETTVGTLTVGRKAKTFFSATDSQAYVKNEGKTYVDELDLVSGTVEVAKGSVLTGETLKGGSVGSDILVDVGGTFGFSYTKSGIEKALESYKGSTDDRAVLALSTDLHFGQGGSLTVGTVQDRTGTVNLGSDALLLIGTSSLHGNALLNGEADQQLHVEKGAVVALTDDLLWGNHYILQGFDAASTEEVLKIGIKDKDGKTLETKSNDRGVFVTIGSDDIRKKDANYRLVEHMNWLLDGRQDLESEKGDVAFLTAALANKAGALATDRMEALSSDAGVMAETQRMGAQVQRSMLEHAVSNRKGYGTFWTDGLISKVESGDLKRTAGVSSYETETTGFAFGADLPVADDSWRVGLAFTAQRGDLEGVGGLDSDIEGYGISVYGGKTFASGLNISTAFSYLTASHDVKTNVLGKVTANVDSDAWLFGTRVSYPFGKNRLWVTPYAGLDLMHVREDAFTAEWAGKKAFDYSKTDATLWRAPVGVKAASFVPLELFGRSGTLNWDADLSIAPQFGDKDAQVRVSGTSFGKTDGQTGDYANDWEAQAKLGLSWQGASGAFGVYYGLEKGDVRKWSKSLTAKAALFF